MKPNTLRRRDRQGRVLLRNSSTNSRKSTSFFDLNFFYSHDEHGDTMGGMEFGTRQTTTFEKKTIQI
jgi:serine/threonine protein kinase